MSENGQEIYLQAYTSYLSLRDFFTTLVNDFNEKQNKKIDENVILNQLDIVIQYSLIEIACADGNINSSEIDYAGIFSKNAKFTDFIESLSKQKLSFEALRDCDAKSMVKLINACNQPVNELANSLINLMLVEKDKLGLDVIKTFKEGSLSILKAGPCADGKQTDDELNYHSMLHDMISYLEEKSGQVPQESNEEAPQPKGILGKILGPREEHLDKSRLKYYYLQKVKAQEEQNK